MKGKRRENLPPLVAARCETPTDGSLDDIRSRFKQWHKFYLLLTFEHYALNISAMTLTLMGVLLPTLVGRDNQSIPVFAAAATVAVAVLAFTTPSKQARKYIEAWRILDDAVLRYPLDHDMIKLINAVAKGEEALGNKDPY